MTSCCSRLETEISLLHAELENLRRENNELKRHVQESREWFFEIFNASPGLIAITRIQDGKILFINQLSADLHGIEREKLIGSSTVKLGLWADPVQRDTVIRKIHNEGKAHNCEVDFVDGNGKIRHVLFSANPVTYNSESCLISAAVDITNHKKTVAALKESEERFLEINNTIKESREYLNQIINCIGDSIFVKDENHEIVHVNDAYCRFSGQKREKILGTNGLEGLSEDIAKTIMDHDERFFETGEGSEEEGVLSDWQGRDRYLMTKKTLFTDKNGKKQLILVSRDITEYKKLEAQFLQAQKMEAIGILAGGVAHDFNNLLNVINGYSELALQDIDQDNPIRKNLKQIQYAGERAAALTSQLLAFGRKQILRPKVVDLNHTITQMGSMLQRLIGEDIQFAVRTSRDLGQIHADPVKIQQIIMNLVVNARDAMPRGGELVIKTVNIYFSEEDVKLSSLKKPGPYVMLAISDNGVGMNAETKSHIFEPFFTTKEMGKGTGLGLATVYGIVKQSNGFIWVYSEPGQGTTFKIYFPRLNDDGSNAEEKDNRAEGKKGTETILLVEDEEGVRDLASHILSDLGYKVIEAGEGFEAFRLAEEYPDEIHLLITDVVMPGMSGSVLVSKLEEIRPGIKTLYISGYTDDAIVHHGIRDTDLAFLEKPFSVFQLTAKVREVLNS